MKRFGGAPLDTLSTRHPDRFLHSPRRMWRSEWPGAPNKTRKLENTPSKLFFFFLHGPPLTAWPSARLPGQFFGQPGGEADGRPFVSAEFRVFSLKARRYKCGELSSDHIGSNMCRKWELKNLSCCHDRALSHFCSLLWPFVKANASVKKNLKKTVHFCPIFDKKLFAFIKSETNLQTLAPSSKAS